NMNNFLQRFVQQQAALDFQLFLIGGKNDNNISFSSAITSNPKAEHISKGIDSHNALAVARDFLSGSLKGNKLSIRSDATKELIFITDDNAENKLDESPAGINQAIFQALIAFRSDKIHIHGIVGTKEGKGIAE